jgi:predicted membrane protein
MKSQHGHILNPKIIVGLAIILIGLLALLVNLGYDVDISIWDYWPVILILIGLSMIFQPTEYRNFFVGSVFVVIGVLFLLSNFDIIDFGFSLLWPIVIILIGIAVIRHGIGGERGALLDADHINLMAILGGGDYNYTSKSLKGGKIFAFMGGGKLDLREADILEDSMVIDAFAMMGGFEIRVPVEWQVTMHGIPILGGMDNKTSFRSKEDKAISQPAPAKHLIIKGTAIMGGVEVKN